MNSSDQVWASVPKFTGKNFQGWKRQILVVLKNRDLIKYLEPKDRRVEMDIGVQSPPQGGVENSSAQDGLVRDDQDEMKETLTQGILFNAMDDRIISHVQTCRTSADIWKRLLLIYENASETNVDRLLQEYYAYMKSAGDDMATHISKVECMADQLGDLGEPQSERSVVSKLLNSLPKDFDSLRNAWDATHPEFRTKDELITRLMKQEVQNKSSFKDSPKDMAMFVRGNFRKAKSGKPKEDLKCYNCGIVGHMARNCRKPKRQDQHKGGYASKGQASTSKQGDHSNQEKDSSQCGWTLFESSKDLSQESNLGYNLNEQIKLKSTKIIVDSGASRHVTPCREFFKTYEPCNQLMQTADDKFIKAEGVGSIDILCNVGDKQKRVTLHDVLHIPDVVHTLLSVGRAAKNGAKFKFYEWGCKIMSNNQVMAIGRSNENSPVPILDAEAVINRAYVVKTERPLADWHNALGHADPQVISEMASNKCVDGLEIAKPNDGKCTICPMGKGTRASHTKDSTFTAIEVGQRVDFDLIGPLPEPSLSNAKYILLTKDKYSGYSHIFVLKSKDETCDKLMEFLTQFENESGSRVRMVNTDNGSEFVNEQVKRLLAVEHVNFQTSAPYTPEQNGTAERNNRTVIETIRTLLVQGELPGKLWAEAANTAVYLRNRIVKRGQKVTPFEMFRGKKPYVGHIVPFGTRVHSLINDRRVGKFDSKTEPGIVVGFTPRMNTYRVYIPMRQVVKITCDVVFKNHYLFEKDCISLEDIVKVEGSSNKSSVKLSGRVDKHQSDNQQITNKPKVSEHLLSDFFDEFRREQSCYEDARSDISEIPSPDYSDITIRGRDTSGSAIDVREQQIVNITDRSENIDDMPILSEHSSLSSHMSRNQATTESHGSSSIGDPPILTERSASISGLFALAESLSQLDEPSSFEEAINGPNAESWMAAIKEEMKAHQDNGTWIQVDRPDNGTTLTAKWIFKLKRDPQGNPKRFKARLVARGYKQREGIDYIETFAPVARMDSIRTLIAIAAAKGLIIEQFDVSTAFLNGDITDNLYIEAPDGYDIDKHKCLKLKRALYGLKQAPRVWNSKFDKTLKKLGFRSIKNDGCVYISEHLDIYIGVYVDDGIIISATKNKCLEVIEQLNKTFKVNRVFADTFLGIDITKTTQGLFLNQKRYIMDVLKRFKMYESKERYSPMNDIKSLFVEDGQVLENIPYRAAIGSLLYCAMLTRPDILFPTVLLSRFCVAPKAIHWTAVKDLMRYLKGTCDLGLLYKQSRDGELDINVYSDADWAGDVESRKSTSGLMILLSGSPIIFASRQQPIVALSSTEAEFVATCEATKELAWLTSFLTELKITYKKPTMQVDNRSAIRLIKNNEVQRRTKHIDIKFHFVRGQYLDGQFELCSVDTDVQLADYLTKSLGGARLRKLLELSSVIKKPP